MAERYIKVVNGSLGTAMPIDGTITQIITSSNVSLLVQFGFDPARVSNVIEFPMSDTNAQSGMVIPVKIPVKAGQKVYCSNFDCLITLS